MGNPNFKKGAPSVNPSGRPALSADIKAALKVGGATAIRKMLGHIDDKNPFVSMEASKWIAERCYGKNLFTLDALPETEAEKAAFAEAMLVRLVATGDRDAVFKALAAWLPDKYGPKANQNAVDEVDFETEESSE